MVKFIVHTTPFFLLVFGQFKYKGMVGCVSFFTKKLCLDPNNYYRASHKKEEQLP
jgi:hypothetical protein